MMYFLLICWYLIGIASFVYWWTTEYDFGIPELIMSLITGIPGPFTFLLGWTIHGKKYPPSCILIRRRSNEKG